MRYLKVQHGWGFVLITLYSCFVRVHSLKIADNAYKNIALYIPESVDELDFGFGKLKTVLSKSSEFLFHATRNRSYFSEFVLYLPSSWKAHKCTTFTREASRKMDIFLTDSKENLQLRTLHSRGCGHEGDGMYMPLSWFDGNTEELAHQFIQQWAIYRYGVFPEGPLQGAPCYKTKESWTPAGCFSTNEEAEMTLNENGLPTCSLSATFFRDKSPASSLMAIQNSSKALDFCDGSSAFPHNPSMPTLHNTLCGGQTVWSVIENSEDFKYARNLPIMKAKSMNTVIHCFRRESLHLTFAIQNNSLTNLREAMNQIGSSLYEFLLRIAPENSEFNLVTFSDENDTSSYTELDLKNDQNLLEQLLLHVKAYRNVTETCISCGFKKALNATEPSSNSSPVIVLIAWASALAKELTSDLTKVMKRYPSTIRLHVILVKDIDPEVVPASLMEVIQSSGGSLYFLPTQPVFMASKLHSILVDVVKNPLEVEDRAFVVHEGRQEVVHSDFVDVFTTPPGTFQKLLYLMYCDPSSDVWPVNSNCSSLSLLPALWANRFKCGEELAFGEKEMPSRTWSYSFKFPGSVEVPQCSSVAILVSNPSRNSFILRGWLNEREINIGRTTLIIYAEVQSPFGNRFDVRAKVSGPGMRPPIDIELRDNGNGDPDTILGDGIYSRYFTSFTEIGTYTVSISAELLVNGISTTGWDTKQVPNPMQYKAIGFFSVTESAPSVDILPPNRIGDLQVVSIDHSNGTVTLQWTAPGGDYDNGKAAMYEIKYSEHPASLASPQYFNEMGNLKLESIGEVRPAVSGFREEHQFYLPEEFHFDFIYIALRALDANANKGKISNIIQIYFNFSSVTGNPLLRTTDETDFSSAITSELSNTTIDFTQTITSSTPDTEFSSTTNDNTSAVPTEETTIANFFDKKTIIIMSSSVGILLLILIINVCICCLWKRKKSDSGQSVGETSLRPPHNINIAYRKDSVSSIHTDTDTGSSMTDPDSIRTSSRPSGGYTYHTSKSLQAKAIKNNSELGFTLVEVPQSYATKSLSRLANRLRDTDSETNTSTSVAEPQQPIGAKDVQVFSLGSV